MNKNSMRLLVAVGLAALLACSWYMLIDTTVQENNEYTAYLEAAREKITAELYVDALENYNAALALRDSVELRSEIADFYREHMSSSNYESYCESLIEDYPFEKIGYEHLAVLYKSDKAYYTCFDIIKSAEKRGIKSEILTGISNELAYAYELVETSLLDVKTYSGGYCEVQRKNGDWGYVNKRGSLVAAGYLQVSPVSSDGLAVVKKSTDRFTVIKISDRDKSLAPQDMQIEESTAVLSGIMAVKYNGKYHYCDVNFAPLFGEYDYAGTFNGGVAAVRNGTKWAIIDQKGNDVTDFIYDDVKLDDKGIAFRNGCAIVKINGSYMIIDSKGNQVCNDSWEDADAFNADMIAAVKKGGKWGYIDKSGNVVVDYQYSAANSFANGMAAVQVSGKWGYIDSQDYTLKIETLFDEVRDFSTGGTAYVKNGETWSLLRIYRLK